MVKFIIGAVPGEPAPTAVSSLMMFRIFADRRVARGGWSWRGLVEVYAVDFLELLLKPDVKWVLGGCDAFKELPWVIRFGK